MKNKLILSLSHISSKDKKRKIFLNLPNINLLKNDKNQIYFYNDRWKYSKNIITDFKYINKVYEINLSILVKFLNTFHKVNLPKKYWRIIIGDWLYTFTCIIFERWQSLKKINLKFKKINLEIFNYDVSNYIPYGNEDFKRFITTNEWNTYIYYEIIKNYNFKNIDKKFKKKYLIIKNLNEIYRRLTLRNNNYKNKILSNFQHTLLKINHKNDYFVFDTYLSNFQEMTLNFKLNKNLNFFKSLKFDDLYPHLIKSEKKLSNKRNYLLKHSKSKFENFLLKLTLQNIPKTYLEYFNLTEEILNKYYLPNNPKIIFTTLGINRSTLMDRYIASKIIDKSKLILGQHGGNYGQNQSHWSSIHEDKISENLLSWGVKLSKKTIPIGIIKTLNKNKYNKKNKLILFETRSRNIYSHKFKIDISAINSKIYMENLNSFFSKIKDQRIMNNLRVKNHPYNYGWYEKKFFLKGNNKLRFIDPARKTTNLYKHSKLIIHSNPSTGHLECMALNIPMLLFCFNDFNLFTNDTKKYFIKFKKLGIIHDNPDSLYNKLNEIYDDPSIWWFSDEVQSIRKEYVDKFAILNNHLINDIAKNLNLIKTK